MRASHLSGLRWRPLIAVVAGGALFLCPVHASLAKRTGPATETFEVVWQGSGSYRYDALVSDSSVNCKTALSATGNYSIDDVWRFTAQVTKKTFTLTGAPDLTSGPFGTQPSPTAHFTGTVTRDPDAVSCFGLIKPRPGGAFDCTGTDFKAILPRRGPQGGRTPSGDVVGPLSLTINQRLAAVNFRVHGWDIETGNFTGKDPRPFGCQWWSQTGFTPYAEPFLDGQTISGFLIDFSQMSGARAPGKPSRRNPHPKPTVVESRDFPMSRAGFNCLQPSDHNAGDSCLVEKNTFNGTLRLLRTS